MSATPPPIPGTPLPNPRAAVIRALCGPLLLTTLGVLLAADRLGAMGFSRTWPALLIMFGLCKLAEHAGGR